MAFTFVLIEPPSLESQGDGRRLALQVIRDLRDAGKRRCSAHPEDRKRSPQCGALLAALATLEGTPNQVRAGFGVVMTDLLGRILSGSHAPEEFEARELHSLFVRWIGETPKARAKEPQEPKAAPEPPAINWGSLNPGRKFRETGPAPEWAETPVSAEPGKARRPAPHPHK